MFIELLHLLLCTNYTKEPMKAGQELEEHLASLILSFQTTLNGPAVPSPPTTPNILRLEPVLIHFQPVPFTAF